MGVVGLAAELRAALAVDPNYIFAVLNLAKLEAGRGHHDDAAAAYRHAARLSPGDPNIFYEWGASENNRRARYYSLTAAGKKQLASEREEFTRIVQAIEKVLNMA